MLVKFNKNVSKGSKFNQIYIPKNMEKLIEVGDEVEVKLINKSNNLFYSKGLKKLSEFKENLIKNIFSFLNNNFNVNYVFIVGSFLTEKIDYNDIDIVLITNETNNKFEELIYNKLIDKFNLKFHILAIAGEKFEYLLKACPLTRTMFSIFISNNQIKVNKEKIIDKKHIQFLLMMPQDLLEIKLNSRTFFDNLRRLITIERFLNNLNLDINIINEELKIKIDNRLYLKIKNNEEIHNNSIDFLRKIIKIKLEKINKMIDNKNG